MILVQYGFMGAYGIFMIIDHQLVRWHLGRELGWSGPNLERLGSTPGVVRCRTAGSSAPST